MLHNRYRITRQLGRGGMGAVYQAVALTFNAHVAIKESFEASPAGQRQFAREEDLLYKLRHPKIPRVTAYFSVPSQGQHPASAVIDYAEGEDLGQILKRRGAVPETQALAWIHEVLGALEYQHGQNPPVIYRDIKPANVKIMAGAGDLRGGGACLCSWPVSRRALGWQVMGARAKGERAAVGRLVGARSIEQQGRRLEGRLRWCGGAGPASQPTFLHREGMSGIIGLRPAGHLTGWWLIALVGHERNGRHGRCMDDRSGWHPGRSGRWGVGMRIEYHYESGGFWALKPEWNDLLHRSCCDTVFLTWEWHTTWWKHLGEGELVLLGFRSEQDGRLVGIAPLFRTRTEDGRPSLNVVGCRDVSDYLDLIVEEGQEDAVYGALLDALEGEIGGWDVVDFCNVPEDSLTTVRLRELAEDRGYQTLVEVEDVCPVIPLPGTWDDYLMMLDKKQRHEVRRKLRRAEGGADTLFVIVGPDRDLQAEMEAFIDLHQKSAPEKDKFMDPQMQAFFYDVAQVLQAQGWLQLAFVEMDGQKAAALLNFDYGNSILVYNSGYDPAQFSHLSPGIIITAYCIEHAIALGRERFDFLRGDEVYKYRFGGQDTEVRRMLIGRPGVPLEVAC